MLLSANRLFRNSPEKCFANRLIFDKEGQFKEVDQRIPLWRDDGKIKVVSEIIALHPGKTICIGDGISDWKAGQIADGFICFAGIVYRPEVTTKTDIVIKEQNLMKLRRYLE